MGHPTLAYTRKLAPPVTRRWRSATALMYGAGCSGLLLLAACGGDSGPNDDLTGNWDFRQVATVAQGVSCTSNAQATLDQSGSTLTGQVAAAPFTCNDADNTSGTVPAYALSNGTINGSAVTFKDDDDCNYTGTLSGSNQIQGNATCPNGVSGTWTLSR